ncbi:MAG: hypothetical protein M3362_24260 [Acidobacteriota bacterium]|nr:hypothetical protein [Acidobacteriota bacterium]
MQTKPKTTNRELTWDEIEAFAADVAERLYPNKDTADKLMILMQDAAEHNRGVTDIIAKRLFMETKAGEESLRNYLTDARARLLTEQLKPVKTQITSDESGGVN